MPRKPLYRTHEYPYHVTARSNNQDWFALPIHSVWALCERQLAEIAARYEVEIIAFVLMSNHFHLLVRTPHANLDAAMNYLLREVSRQMGRKSGRINHIFGGPYKWSLINHDHYFAHAYKYVYRNPVVAGLVRRPEHYPFSTLHYRWHRKRLGFPVADGFVEGVQGIPLAWQERVVWLQQGYSCREAEAIRKALRRRTFQFPQGKNHHKLVQRLSKACWQGHILQK